MMNRSQKRRYSSTAVEFPIRNDRMPYETASYKQIVSPARVPAHPLACRTPSAQLTNEPNLYKNYL